MIGPDRQRCPSCGTVIDWGQPQPALWRRDDMRTALAERDISTVYKILQRHGISQRRIAGLTGQSQSEISEIIKGRRVVSYDLLSRIADGLGVHRGLLGLAYVLPEPDDHDHERPSPYPVQPQRR